MLRNAYNKQRHGIWQKTLLKVFLPIFIFSALLVGTVGMAGPESAEAATSSTLNFQGRLLTNTGGLVPDGSYNIQFNLYTVASGGSTEWTETHTNLGGNPITVQNGYFSVDLGNATTGTAFPGSINWDQEHWLGMTVRGSGAGCAFAACTPADNEMTPRFKLTAVPYAFRAGALVDASGNAKTADQFAQLAPSSVQSVNAAVSALRIAQAGSGGFVQFQNGGVDVFAVSNTGATTLGSTTTAGQLTLHDGTGNTTTFLAGDSGSDLTFTFPTGDGTAGQCIKTDGSGVLSFDDCGTGGGGGAMMTTVVKTADEIENSGVNATAALQNDDELFFSIGANETKAFRFVLQANAPATPDIKFAVTAPSGATCVVGVVDPEAGASVANLGCGVSSGLITGNGVADIYEVVGTVTNGSTAGTVNLQWAQNTANAANTTVHAGSYLQEATDGTAATNNFQNGGNTFGGTATLGTNDGFGLNIITNGATVVSITSSGSVDFVNDVEIGNGLTITGGGLDLSNSGITNAGSVAGVTTITGSGGILGLGSATLQRSAAGTTSIDLLDAGAGTTLSIINSDGTMAAGLTVEGAITGATLVGAGSGITNIDAANIATGTLADARLSSNVVLLGSNQTFTGLPTFDAGLVLGNSTSTTAGALRWSGTDFEGYDGIQWISLAGGGGGGGGASQSITVDKAANETENSATNPTATLQNDDELLFPIAANEVWSFSFEVQATSPAAAGIKFAVTAPSGATCVIGASDEENAESTANNGCGATMAFTTNGTSELYRIVGTVTNGGTAGSVRLQWAQNTANAGNTTVLAGSYVLASSGDAPVPGSEYVQGGNAFGSTGVIGTTDAEDFNLISNSTTQLSLTAGGQAVFTGEILANGGITIGNAASDGLTIVSDAVSLTNGLNFDSNTFVIDSGNNFVGINNSAPANRLSLNTASTNDSLAQALISTNAAANKGLVIQGVGSQTANLFELQNNSGTVLGGFSSSGALVLGQSTISSLATVSRAVSLPDEAGTICLSASSSCGFLPYATGSYVTDATNNNTLAINKTSATGNLVSLQRSGGAVFTVANSGALQIQATSSAALDIRNGSGTTYFLVDTTTGTVQIGATTADATGVLFVLDTKNTNGDPTGTVGAQYYNSARGTFRCYENGRGWTDCLGVPKPNTRRTARFMANGSATTLTSDGGDAATVSGTGSAAAATTTIPASVNYATANAANNDGGISGNTNYNSSMNPSLQVNTRLVTTASTRSWVGFTNQTLATMNGGANPAGIYAAFRYDTSAGDTNWQCITKNGGAQNILDSGIAASTNSIEMEIIIVNGTSVQFKVNDVVVCTSVSELPASGTMMRYTAARRNLVTGAQSLQVAWLYLESDQ